MRRWKRHQHNCFGAIWPCRYQIALPIPLTCWEHAMAETVITLQHITRLTRKKIHHLSRHGINICEIWQKNILWNSVNLIQNDLVSDYSNREDNICLRTLLYKVIFKITLNGTISCWFLLLSGQQWDSEFTF